MDNISSQLPTRREKFIRGATAKEAPGQQVPSPAEDQKETDHFEEQLPWEEPFVRADVIKSLHLRIDEPLLLKLKWVAAQTGMSQNKIVLSALSAEVESKISSLLRRPD